MAFRHLLSGFDTIECAYYLAPKSGGGLGFTFLEMERESLRQSKLRRKAIRLGSEEFLLASHGTGSGYSFLLENDAFSVQCGEFNKPNFFVTYRSIALWHQGAMQLHQRFLAWADSVGMVPYRDESLSRVDFTFDYWLDPLDFDEDNFVTTAELEVKYRKNRVAQTFSMGASPILLRVYNKSDEISEKSDKTWFIPLWGGQEENVWRIEWELRKEILKFRGVRTFDSLYAQRGDVLRPLVETGTTLRLKTKDSNRSRWPLHPLWADLQHQVAQMECQGVIQHCDPQALLDERMMRCAVAVYGYMKRIAAIHGLQRGKDEVSKTDALYRLSWLMDKVHDPLSWDSDVQRRMTEMRLGR